MQRTKTVWIGDDDAEDREMICESLSSCARDLQIDCFESGGLMLAKLNVLEPSAFPHIILLDHHMPGPTGLDVLAKIKGDEATSHIPVILISGRVSENERKSLIKKGANFIITKPNTFTELQAISESICRLWLSSAT